MGTPLQWVFDRTESSGLERGQYLVVSLSAADDYVGLSTQALRRLFVPEFERLFPKARHARVEHFLVTRERSATFLQATRHAAQPPWPQDAAAGSLPGRRVDRHRLAGHHGERRDERRGGRARSADRRWAQPRASSRGRVVAVPAAIPHSTGVLIMSTQARRGNPYLRLPGRSRQADPRQRGELPAVSSEGSRLLGGRARDQRHDGCRGPDASPVPRHRRPGADPAGGAPGSARSSSRDGTWNISFEGPPDLSATVEAYVALRLAGDPADAEHMERAARRVREMGGLEGSRVFTRFWLALFGEWSWDDLPALPPEVILLPSWFPLNIYDFGCWARQTIVPLTIVAAHRPSRPLGFGLEELRVGKRRTVRKPVTTWAGRFQLLDRMLHALREVARRAAAPARTAGRCRVDHSSSGGRRLLGRHPAPVGLLADGPAPARLPAGPPGDEEGDRGARQLRHHRERRSPLRGLPVAGLGHLSGVVALSEAGVPEDHPALLRAADWMLDEEVRVQGDWAVRRPDLAPGGWAFEYENDNYPDLDDTAEVVMALRGIRHPDPKRVDAAVARAVRWTLGMQCSDGGWAAFDVDNTRDASARSCPSAISERSSTPERRRHRPRRRDARR